MAKRTSIPKDYQIIEENDYWIVLKSTKDSLKTPIPRNVLIEYQNLLYNQLIRHDMKSEVLRPIVQKNSDWDKYYHGYDARIMALCRYYEEIPPQKSELKP